jgi:hypothetical protein
MLSSRVLFSPVDSVDEDDDFFDYKSVSSHLIRKEDLIKVSLLGDIQNVIVRDVRQYSDCVSITVSEVGGAEYVTERFTEDQEFLISARFSFVYEEEEKNDY